MEPLKDSDTPLPWHLAEAEAARSRRRLWVIAALTLAAGLLAYYFTLPQGNYALSRTVIMRLDSHARSLVARAAQEPCNRPVARELAARLLMKAEYAAVIAYISHLEARCGGDEDLRAALYHAQLGSSDYAAAEAAASALIQNHPSSSQAYFWRFEARKGKGDIQGAYDDLKKAYYLLPDPSAAASKVYYDLSHMAAQLGQPCEAVHILRDYLAYDPARRTSQVDALIGEWRGKGNCPSPFGSGSARLRYRPGAASIVMPVVINGEQAKMIVDTGATRTMISQALAKRAGIEPSDAQGVFAGTANGVIWVPGGRAKEIALGDARISDVPVFIEAKQGQLTLPGGAEGLLGMSFLGHFKFTMSQGVLELKPQD